MHMARNPDSKTIRELAEILNEANLTEIEVEVEGMRLRVARAEQVTVVSAPSAPAPTTQAPAAAAPPAEAAAPVSLVDAVKSPMVGTVYVAPDPNAPPFIKEGDTVSAGQTLFIIEAMKTMNPVAAPKAGTVKSILVHNAQPVEFDEPLVIIE
jgi:acetyl-CoA carboxylase biotin carboxyl carrier protein